MLMKFTRALAFAAVTSSRPVVAAAHSVGETIRPVFSHKLPNMPGKSIVAILVEYAPGGKSPPHIHAKSAFVYAQILSGAIISKVGQGKSTTFVAGQNFYENPGSVHSISENASKTKPASLLAVFIVDSDDTNLTTPLHEE